METKLSEVLLLAVVDSVAERLSAVEGGVAGYALVVDGGMLSVHGVSVSRASVDGPVGRRALFSPEDWPEGRASELFEVASEQLRRLPANSYELRARACMQAMVEALEGARARLDSLRDALLLVACADGGGVWWELEGDAVRRLNGEAVYQQWLKQLRSQEHHG
jgi:hypothetical protein